MFLLQSIYLDEPVSKKSASVELEEVINSAFSKSFVFNYHHLFSRYNCDNSFEKIEQII